MSPLLAVIAAAAAAALSSAAIPLPGGPPVGMDYLAFDAANGRVWVPAGNTGRVDVVDARTRKVTAVEGFPTAPSPRPGRPAMGPSSATVASDVVWVGNRADRKLCAIDRRGLQRRGCLQLGSMPDGVAYVAATGELWVTTPRDHTVTVVAAAVPGAAVADAGLAAAATIAIDGDPEGYAVDDAHGIFYTNVEDKDRTLAIDVRTHAIKATFHPGCGADGPGGTSP
jgi:DNA-binding beta-propeller fold protein YncE